MRVRKPPLEKEKPKSIIQLGEKRWRPFEVVLITPMFGGGVSAACPDEAMPVRVAAIRGQLRYWWRFLNSRNFSDKKKLFEKERELWGGASEENNGFASEVRIKIENVSQPVRFNYTGIAGYA